LRKPFRSAAEISQGEDGTSTKDADPDFAGAGNGQHEHLAACAACCAKRVGPYYRRSVPSKRRRVRGEVAEQAGSKGASAAPQRKSDEKADAVLGKPSCQHDDHRSSHESADDAVA
jgi:hypothetical protein